MPIKDADGVIVKWFGSATNINDQKLHNRNLEEMVALRTLELSRSNEDLQQFAHVASHDLKEPLRKIRTFSDLLIVDFAAQLPEKAKTYINKLSNSSERMSDMIDSVLKYSVVNATEQRAETVDLNLLVEGIQNDLELLIIQKNAKIIYDDLPKIKAVSALMYQLFYNLINNALKFSKADVPLVIKIKSAILSPSELSTYKDLNTNITYHHFIFSDNGIGFNQEYAVKMFNVFTRLNARDKYEGTGLGLALCKKIVERHHGIIYAEGEEEVGATFHIILPKEKK